MNQEGSASTYYTVTFDIENGQNASYVPAIFTNPSDITRQVEAGQPVGELPSINPSPDYWGTTPAKSSAEQVTSSTIITSDVVFYALFGEMSG